MQYLLTDQELKDLKGNPEALREALRKEYEEKLYQAKERFVEELSQIIRENSPSLSRLEMPRGDVMPIVNAIKEAMSRCGLEPKPKEEGKK